MLALLLVGCPKPKATEAAPDLVSPDAAGAPVATGRVLDGAYVDGAYPLSVAVPPGWVAVPGADASAVRVVLQDPEGDVTVSIVGVRGDVLAPRPLPGCTWTFVDTARYRAVKVRGAVLAATCTPEDAAGARVLTYVVAQEGMLWNVEGRVPQGHLRARKLDLDVIAGGVRFR